MGYEIAVEVEVVRVFVGPDGRGGNPLGIVRDGPSVPGDERRLALAAQLGFSETVFVDDPARGAVDIWTPSVRLPFAGHPLIGTAWLLGADVLRPPVGEVPVRRDADGTVWIAARPEWASGRRTRRYASVAEVDTLPAPPPGEGWLYAWAWEDEAAGQVRARGFPRRGDGIAEDEATGAAALVLAGESRRDLDIRQGAASRIRTRSLPDGTVEVGGRVTR
ncbi:PhzF family phenazine biosynthesis protein [Streptomyces sp. AV19]|uniref:PhzF family phenazine biosynthesis protein n=1 Tax=Streptomyces sp. AV19 TaxID=2793068 RepID=UPI0018FE72EC|nr:PhzF family phenazine biosynthesis protein [Streptomyces sp. AV19]MBH1933447.1 PhzF family phenazine biosynthesis protein [Streptomyces sp. AV19]MDG4532096.1 PhzF family phenazine biosynthesis protein [Streptomyces sp. AV19]